MNYTNQYYSNFLGWIVPFGLIPINEIYAWSNNEKIHILFHKIGELIKTSNIYGESMVEILKWIEDNKDAIKKTLAEMAKSGELTNIVSDILNENPDIITEALARNPELLTNAVKEQIETMLDNGSLNDVLAEVFSEVNDGKHTTMDLARMWRVCFEAHSYNATTFNEEKYSAMQASCHFEYQGQGYVAMYLYCRNDSPHIFNDNGWIRIYKDNGEFVIDKYVSWGHCNSFAFDETNGWLYGAVSAVYNGDPQHRATYSKDIKRLRFTGTTLGAEETRTVPVGTHINGVSWYNNQLYVCQGLKIWKFDWNTATAINEVDLNYPSGVGTLVGWSFTDEYLYVGMYKPNGFLRINRNTLKIDWICYFGEMQNQGMFLLGEVEGISIDHDNNLWVFSFQRMQPIGILTHHLSQVFKQNLDRNDVLPQVVRTHTEGEETLRVNGVDNSFSGYWNGHSCNPNGEEGNAFNFIQEAIWFYSNYTGLKNCIIDIDRNTGWYTSIATNKPIWIRGSLTDNDNPVSTTNLPLYEIGGIDVNGNSHFRVTGCTISNHMRAKDSVGTNDPYVSAHNPSSENINSSVYLVNSIGFFRNCYFRNYNSFWTGTKYGMYANGSIVHNINNIKGSQVDEMIHSDTSMFFGNYHTISGE